MACFTFRTAGESHGRGLLAILEGIPHGFEVHLDAVQAMLRRRQSGYGRSSRQKLETDQAEILSGLRGSTTLGGPLTLWIRNADHRIEKYRRLTSPRPGHADLAGAQKYGLTDVGDVMERASARETAARVAAGAVASQILSHFGISVFAATSAIGAVEFETPELPLAEAVARREQSEFLSLDPTADLAARSVVELARTAGDTVGGRFFVRAAGLPPGLGDPTQWDRRLNGRLAQALMSIHAIKAVEIGLGRESAGCPGSKYHDPILPPKPSDLPRRTSNHAGGLEGGMTNGEVLSLSATMKPIPTLARPLSSFDLISGLATEAVYERSDVCAVPAASVVGESMTALVLLQAFLEKFAGDSCTDVETAFEAYQRRLRVRNTGSNT